MEAPDTIHHLGDPSVLLSTTDVQATPEITDVSLDLKSYLQPINNGFKTSLTLGCQEAEFSSLPHLVAAWQSVCDQVSNLKSAKSFSAPPSDCDYSPKTSPLLEVFHKRCSVCSRTHIPKVLPPALQLPVSTLLGPHYNYDGIGCTGTDLSRFEHVAYCDEDDNNNNNRLAFRSCSNSPRCCREEFTKEIMTDAVWWLLYICNVSFLLRNDFLEFIVFCFVINFVYKTYVQYFRYHCRYMIPVDSGHPKKFLLSKPKVGWNWSRGYQFMKWHRALREATRMLAAVGSHCLSGWGTWFSSLEDVTHDRCHWRSWCKFSVDLQD